MDFEQYQRIAATTDQQAEDPDRRLVVAMLGLAGEVGTLLTEHKKWLRDGDAHDRRTAMVEDIGDILWYLAATSTALGVSLADAASANILKIQDRWPSSAEGGSRASILFPPRNFDAGFPPYEQLPRQLSVSFVAIPGSSPRVAGFVGSGPKFGALLTDNAYTDDGYRWHDALHLGLCAVLGWSPVVRSLLKRKRRSSPRVDEVEDGGRAIAIEEGISAAAFDYASRHAWLEGVRAIDTTLLGGFRSLTRGLEVAAVTLREWEVALIQAFEAWRLLRRHSGGRLDLDLDQRSIAFAELSSSIRDSLVREAAEL